MQESRPHHRERPRLSLSIGTIDQLFAPGDVISEISPRDEMHRADSDYYFNVGQRALHNIGLAMLATHRTGLWNILDLPSGHGRVLRTLKAAFPTARLTACDIDTEAVEFCAKVFGATPVVSKEDPEGIDLQGPFDLIWCGSLLTHVSADRWPRFLGLFESKLAEYGLLLFSVHGRFSAELARLGKLNYGLQEADLEALLRDFDRDGFGYVEYGDSLKERIDIPTYGVSMSSPSRVFEQVQAHPLLRVVSYAERAWCGHDVVACLREPLPGLGAEQVEWAPAEDADAGEGASE
jgi:trans-aconitate methyltransferase